MKTYYIDVMVRGNAPGAVSGEEPVIVATRMALQVPAAMESSQVGKALGEEIRKMGLRFVGQSDQLGISIDRYEEAIEETRDYSDVPPEFRPN